MNDPSLSSLEIGCGKVKAKLDAGDDFLLLDCREQEEYEISRLDTARLLPMSTFPGSVQELEPFRDRQIVVHCHHGMRSLQVAAWLRQQGFPHVWSMAGGIDAWAQTIDPKIPRY